MAGTTKGQKGGPYNLSSPPGGSGRRYYTEFIYGGPPPGDVAPGQKIYLSEAEAHLIAAVWKVLEIKTEGDADTGGAKDNKASFGVCVFSPEVVR